MALPRFTLAAELLTARGCPMARVRSIAGAELPPDLLEAHQAGS